MDLIHETLNRAVAHYVTVRITAMKICIFSVYSSNCGNPVIGSTVISEMQAS